VDQANAAAAASVTVYADGHYDLATEATNAGNNQNITNYLMRQAPRYLNLPAISLASMQFIQQFAKDTAGFT
jgi:hypothetical protein